MKAVLIVTTLLIAQAIPTTAQSREKNLDRWLDRELIPYVQQQLVRHPRFDDETVMFVVLDDNAPASRSNALALALRDRVLEAAVDTAGVSVGWLQGRDDSTARPHTTDCDQSRVHYYIGIELTQELDGSYAVNVRALDLEDRTWVTGFGKRWQGGLSTVQRQALRQQRIDQTFLGAREVPFKPDQTDLLAAYLAQQLTCTLQSRLGDEYVVATDIAADESPLRNAIELIGNNLARRHALELTTDPSRSNATLSAKAHRIDGDLYQYWLTVTPAVTAGNLSPLSASAYVRLPDAGVPRTVVARRPPAAATVEPATSRPPATSPSPAVVSIPNAGDDGLISPLRITHPDDVSRCRWPCSLLSTRANIDAIVFFLEHQTNHGLVRLSDGECRRRTVAKTARRGESLSFPISKTTTDSSKWSETFDWSLKPNFDTYYAVVVTNAAIARRMANHMDKLPLRCGSAMRPGLQGADLQNWVDEFAGLTARASKHLDWRAIEVRDIL